jgi:hypothetical protein
MDGTTAPAAGAGWTITVLLAFLWLIPLFHASRGGRALPVIEVLVLLGASAVLPIAGGVFTAGAPVAGAVFLIPLVGIAGGLWFAALLIALSAELAESFRPPKRRYPPPTRIPDEPVDRRGRA